MFSPTLRNAGGLAMSFQQNNNTFSEGHSAHSAPDDPIMKVGALGNGK